MNHWGRLIVVLLGGPGAGKGTQAQVITNWLRIPQISTGQILRSEIARETEVGKRAKALVDAGGLVDDVTANALVANRIRLPDCRDGFILDGYPRNVQQAAAFDGQLRADDRLIVIGLVTDLERIIERLERGRLIEGRCDDREEVIRSRFATHCCETLPVMEFYRKSGVYHAVDGMQPPSHVAEAIAAILRNERTGARKSAASNVGFLRKAAPILALVSLMTACSAGRAGPTDSPARSTDPKTITNPVAATPRSIAAGKKLFDRLCANCHGTDGNGVSETATKLAEAGKTKPSDLTDDKWDHGSTDGEIFAGIRDGVGADAAMRGLNGKPGIGPTEMWHLVNYVRSIGPRP